MKEPLISFKTAVLAKEKGFQEYCQKGYYPNGNPTDLSNFEPEFIGECCYSPTQSVLQQWLREKNIFLTVRVDSTFEPKFCYTLKWLKEYSDGSLDWLSTNHQNYTFNGKGGYTYSDLYYKYEEALEDGLYEALHIIP